MGFISILVKFTFIIATPLSRPYVAYYLEVIVNIQKNQINITTKNQK